MAIPQSSSVLPLPQDTSADQMCALPNGSGDLYGRVGRLCFESPACCRDLVGARGSAGGDEGGSAPGTRQQSLLKGVPAREKAGHEQSQIYSFFT